MAIFLLLTFIFTFLATPFIKPAGILAEKFLYPCGIDWGAPETESRKVVGIDRVLPYMKINSKSVTRGTSIDRNSYGNILFEIDADALLHEHGLEFAYWKEMTVYNNKSSEYKTLISNNKFTYTKKCSEPGAYIVIYPISKDRVPVKSIKLNTDYLQIKPQEFYQLLATIEPNNASNKKVSWSSSDRSTVDVDQNGKIFAARPGTVEIKVITEESGHKYSCTVEVIIPVERVQISPSQKDIHLDINESINLTAVIIPANASNENVEWFFDS